MARTLRTSTSMKLHLLTSLLVVGLLAGCAAPAEEGPEVILGAESELSESPEIAEGESISRFAQVSPGIYRGGQPEAKGIEYLKELGVKTIIDLRYDGWPDENAEELDSEERIAKAAGIEYLNYGISAYRPIKDEQISKILAVLKDAGSRPVYVHCKRGRDRTGLVIALHRVLHEGWTHSEAYDEMIDRGFRKRYFQMLRYFDRKTEGLP